MSQPVVQDLYVNVAALGSKQEICTDDLPLFHVKLDSQLYLMIPMETPFFGERRLQNRIGFLLWAHNIRRWMIVKPE